jgi:hypothetical protein
LSIKIALTDEHGNPKVNHEVHIRLKGSGGTNGKTNSSGVYDTGLSGTNTISKVTVYGRVLHDYNLQMSGDETLALEYR